MISYKKILFEVKDPADEETFCYLVIDNKEDNPYLVQVELQEAINNFKESKKERDFEDFKKCISRICEEHGWGIKMTQYLDLYF